VTVVERNAAVPAVWLIEFWNVDVPETENAPNTSVGAFKSIPPPALPLIVVTALVLPIDVAADPVVLIVVTPVIDVAPTIVVPARFVLPVTPRVPPTVVLPVAPSTENTVADAPLTIVRSPSFVIFTFEGVVIPPDNVVRPVTPSVVPTVALPVTVAEANVDAPEFNVPVVVFARTAVPPL